MCGLKEAGKIDWFTGASHLFWIKSKKASEFSNSVRTQMPASLSAAKHERRTLRLAFEIA
jgi:hypothetical protein